MYRQHLTNPDHNNLNALITLTSKEVIEVEVCEGTYVHRAFTAAGNACDFQELIDLSFDIDALVAHCEATMDEYDFGTVTQLWYY